MSGHLGAGQGRGVVHPVTDHRHRLAAALQLDHLAVLVLRQHVGEHLIDLQFGRDRVRHLLGVPGDHGHLDPALVQGRHRVAGGLAHLILQGQCTNHLSLAQHVQDAGAALRPGADLLGNFRRGFHAQLAQQVRSAHAHLCAVHRGAHAPAGLRGEVTAVQLVGRGLGVLLGGRDDGAGHRVLTVGFRRGGHGKQLSLGNRGNRRGAGHRVGALGQGAGLVKEHHVNVAHALQCDAVLHQHPGARGAFGGDGNHQRDGQAQRVRAGNDQHRHGAHHRVIGLADEHPDDEGQDAGTQGKPEQPGGRPVGQRLGAGGGLLGLGDQALDSGQRGVLAGGLHLNAHRVACGHRSGHHVLPGVAVDGLGLAGDHRLVELRAAIHNPSVGRNAGAGADQDGIAGLQLVQGHGFGAVLGHLLRLIGQQFGQRIQRAGGRAQGAHLHPVAQEHDDHQQRQLPPEVQHQPANAQARGPGCDQGHGDGHGNQQHHSRLAGLQFRNTAGEEGPAAVEVDDGAQDRGNPLDPGELGNLVAEQVGEHRAEVDHGNGEHQADPEHLAEHGGVIAVATMSAMSAVATMSAVAGMCRMVFVPGVILVIRRMLVLQVLRVLGGMPCFGMQGMFLAPLAVFRVR